MSCRVLKIVGWLVGRHDAFVTSSKIKKPDRLLGVGDILDALLDAFDV